MAYEYIDYTDPEVYGYDGSGISLNEITFHEDDDKVIERLAKFFREKTDLGPRRKMRKSRAKARSLFYENYDEGKILSQYNYGKGREKAIKQAISNGYIHKITIDKPWHPRIFVDQNYIYTYFLQHKYVVLYSGQKKHIFFKEEGKQDLLERRSYDHFNNAGSIMGQGYLAKDDSNRFTEKRQTYYTTEPSQAKSYGSQGDQPLYNRSVVLEVCVPRSFLKFQVKNGYKESNPNLDSITRMNKFFGSPKKHSPTYSNVEFHIRKRLPLSYIMRVWDVEKNTYKPVFTPLNKYASIIKREFPRRVPDLGNTNLSAPQQLSEESKEELSYMKELDEIEKEYLSKGGLFSTLESYLRKLEQENQYIVSKVKTIYEESSSLSSDGGEYHDLDRLIDNLFRNIENYNEFLEKALDLAKELRQIDLEPGSKEVKDFDEIHESAALSLKMINENRDQIQMVEEEREEKLEDIESLKKHVMESQIPPEKFRKITNSFTVIEKSKPENIVKNLYFIEMDEEKITKEIYESEVKIRDNLRSTEKEIERLIKTFSNIEEMEKALEDAEDILNENNFEINSDDTYYLLNKTLSRAENLNVPHQFTYALLKCYLLTGIISLRRNFDPGKLNAGSEKEIIKIIEQYRKRIREKESELEEVEMRCEGRIKELEEIDEKLVSNKADLKKKKFEKKIEKIAEKSKKDQMDLKKFISGFKEINLDKDQIIENHHRVNN